MTTVVHHIKEKEDFKRLKNLSSTTSTIHLIIWENIYSDILTDLDIVYSVCSRIEGLSLFSNQNKNKSQFKVLEDMLDRLPNLRKFYLQDTYHLSPVHLLIAPWRRFKTMKNMVLAGIKLTEMQAALMIKCFQFFVDLDELSLSETYLVGRSEHRTAFLAPLLLNCRHINGFSLGIIDNEELLCIAKVLSPNWSYSKTQDEDQDEWRLNSLSVRTGYQHDNWKLGWRAAISAALKTSLPREGISVSPGFWLKEKPKVMLFAEQLIKSK